MVSVVVPAYNASKYLSECLKSILAQSYSDIDVIIVDDGSSDDTCAIADSYARSDSRVKVVRQENGGVSRARNRGVQEAKGETITFVDADDMLHPKFIETLMRLRKLSGAEIAIAGYLRSTECTWAEISEDGYETVDSAEAISRSLYQTHAMDSVPWAKLAPTELYRQVPFREGIIYEDLDHFYKIYEKIANVVKSPHKLYFYRDNPASCINTFRPARWDAIEVTRLIEEHYADNQLLLPPARTRRFAANFNIFILGSIYGKDMQGLPLCDCWKLVKSYRWSILTDPKARQKDKAGVLISFLGKKVALAIAKFFY